MDKTHRHSDPASTRACGAKSHCCGPAAALASSPISITEPPAEQAASAGPELKRFRIANMDCMSEESEIRHALAPLSGLSQLRFDLGRRTVSLAAEPAELQAALAAIRRIGYKPEALTEGAEQDAAPGAGGGACSGGHSHAHAHEHDHATAKPAAAVPAAAGFGSGLPRLLAALALAVGAEALAFFAPDAAVFKGAQMALAAAAIFLAGFATYQKGLMALRVGRLNINALMTVAVSGAFVIGQWPEAAMVMALYALAELIEARAVDRARNAIKSLLDLAPPDAEVLQADGSWLRQPTSAIAVGASVRLRPGERVPLDGIVSQGTSAVDQAPVTGESVPVDKTVGDELYAGTINQNAALEFRVTALAGDSTLARVIHAVEEAQASRAPTQRFVDRFAALYTPAVFVLALALALLAPWLLGWSWTQSVYKALVLLVIACPCALVISTPVTVVSGLAAAARRGILVKGGVYLEQARSLKAVALDKTGTITEGRPKLVAQEFLREGAPQAPALQAALSIAGRSDHPVSKAIAAGLADQAASAEVQGFEAVVGRGVQASLAGSAYVLGNHRWIEERGHCSAALEARLRLHEQAGRTVTLLADAQGVLALFAVADTIKPSSKTAVAELQALGVATVMLTGDNQATAEAIGAEAGIRQVRGQLLPQDKLAAITQLQASHGPTAMTGDGINDAPALARADIGFAMGGAGTHTAMEAADVIVMNDDLQRLPELIRLSRRTHAVLWQNISLALGIKAVFLVAAVLGNASMWMAVFADMGASLLVVFNGLRLLRSRD
ncbi:Cd2+/Zn2+-exporting ATPase [Paucibacter oligotrophus]|uniref:P-type Zn(2+) transporter n=1 Tax=Roseateles oligotrophus TaxID=1769250 RepID=A0A840L2Q8_9BURK|nr:heavy metal translocating P-type ATPase [Roseateles oligotrophus]MBB4842216.1 Cd2+/Zn2+-exporting ATPase [Roseateles oligotrophus]